jgi:hypothetical protein
MIRRIINLRALVANPQNVGAAGNMLLGALAGAALNTGVETFMPWRNVLGSYHHVPCFIGCGPVAVCHGAQLNACGTVC